VEPSELVQLFADRRRELEAMTALVGSVNTRELRSVEVADTTRARLHEIAERDPNAKVRAEARYALG
jgi:hypothetical protein